MLQQHLPQICNTFKWTPKFRIFHVVCITTLNHIVIFAFELDWPVQQDIDHNNFHCIGSDQLCEPWSRCASRWIEGRWNLPLYLRTNAFKTIMIHILYRDRYHIYIYRYITKHEWHLYTIHVYIRTYNTCAFVWLEQACNCRYNMSALKGLRSTQHQRCYAQGKPGAVALTCPGSYPSQHLGAEKINLSVAAVLAVGGWELVAGSWKLVDRWKSYYHFF